MNLLLTNDDGIASEGLRALACVLFEKGHTVTVVAPSAINLRSKTRCLCAKPITEMGFARTRFLARLPIVPCSP